MANGGRVAKNNNQPIENSNTLIVFAALCVTFTIALIFRNSTAVIFDDLMRDFAVPAASLGLMSSAYFIAYASAQIPIGILADRIGVTKTVFFFGFLGFVGVVLFSFSTNIQVAALGRFLTGAGTAGFWIPTLKYLTINFKADRFATMASIMNGFGCFGLLLATLPMALLAASIGWRQAFLFTAMLFLALLIMTRLLLKKNSAAYSPEQPQPRQPLDFSYLKHKYYWRFLLWSFLDYGVLLGFVGLLGATYLQDIFFLDQKVAGNVLLYATLGMIIGGVLWGVVSDRVFKARRPVIILGSLGGLMIWTIILRISFYPGLPSLKVLYFFMGFCAAAFLINQGCVKELLPSKISATAMGTVNAAMFFGVAVYQSVTGYMLDYFSNSTGSMLAAYKAIFSLYLVSMFLALLLTLIMPETFPRQQAEKFNSR